eukprot:gene732-8984_t
MDNKQNFFAIFDDPDNVDSFICFEKIFNRYDKNNNKTLDQKEYNKFQKDLVFLLEEYLQNLSHVSDEVERKTDLLMDTSLEQSESEKLQEEISKNLEYVSKNIDKRFLKNTFRELSFEDLDVDKNGEIDFQEFVSGLSLKIKERESG